jgi:hypothetical protein
MPYRAAERCHRTVDRLIGACGPHEHAATPPTSAAQSNSPLPGAVMRMILETLRNGFCASHVDPQVCVLDAARLFGGPAAGDSGA